MGLLLISEGAESMLLSLIIGILTVEWNLNDLEKSLTISFTFFGLLIGSLLAGYISDTYGRKICA